MDQDRGEVVREEEVTDPLSFPELSVFETDDRCFICGGPPHMHSRENDGSRPRYWCEECHIKWFGWGQKDCPHGSDAVTLIGTGVYENNPPRRFRE